MNVRSAGVARTTVWALALVGALAGSAAALSRPHDPVIVAWPQLAGLLSERDTARLRVYRRGDDGWEPIPYQFDAREADGLLEHTGTDFRLDAHDELVFMARDSGPRAAADDPLPDGASDALEIAVRDPRDGQTAWAYLLTFATPPPRAAITPYVTIAPNGERATSASYSVDYARGRNFYTGLRISPQAGGDGRNLLRQTAMVGEPTLRLLFTDLQLRFDEQSAIVEVTATRAGPVRAIRQVRLSVDLGRFFPDLPNGLVHTYHYATAVDAPSRVSVPWLVLEALRDFRFENVVVFDPAVMPLRYWDASHPEGIPLTEAITPARDADHDWWAVDGAAGAFLQHLDIPERWQRWGIARGPVTRVAGDAPVAGYELLHMTRLRESGEYPVRQLLVILPGGVTPERVQEALRVVHQPLEVEVRRR